MRQVLYFNAKWCTACATTTPLIEQVKRNNPSNVMLVDVDYDVSLTQQYNVRKIPTTIVLENGNEIKRHEGTITSEGLNNLING